MQTVEINGFVIDNFNQHGLDEGKTQGTCPLCSSTRKPENQKQKCASYDWERGLGTCHNCDNHFSYTLTSAKVLRKRHMSSLKPLLFKRWVAK